MYLYIHNGFHWGLFIHIHVYFDLLSLIRPCPFLSCPVLTPGVPLLKLPLFTLLSFNSSQPDDFVSLESTFFLCIIPAITQLRKDDVRVKAG